jgi:hypothetical protein
MWFLGAGASSAAGVPTAGHLVWDFKRQLYCAAQSVRLSSISDLADPVVQARLQQFFDDLRGYPPAGADDEYAFYFERAYPAVQDRRAYIAEKVSAASPTYGHLALAGLLSMDMAHVDWTTNFDRVIEDAVFRVFGSTTSLVVATLSEPSLALQAMNAHRWPLLGKLHGDFQSERLMNIPEEIRKQDADLRRALLEGCRRYGLAVIGYSGRDASVMDTLEEAIDEGQGYPFGLFWFHRSASAPSIRVKRLVERARTAGIEAQLIQVETFDELLSDVMNLVPDIPLEVTELLDKRALRLTAATIPGSEGRWPVLRLNALPLLRVPMICRRIICDIGGAREVQEAIKTSGAQIIAARRNVGVLAFGDDSQVLLAFGPHNIQTTDIHSIESHRLGYESAEQGLMFDALTRALERERPVVERRRGRRRFIAVEPSQLEHESIQELRQAAGQLTGVVRGTHATWLEAIEVHLEYKFNRLWLLIEPTVWVERQADSDPLVLADFIRGHMARRFNDSWNSILDGWIRVLIGEGNQSEIRSFDISAGLDASFIIGRTSGYSTREG